MIRSVLVTSVVNFAAHVPAAGEERSGGIKGKRSVATAVTARAARLREMQENAAAHRQSLIVTCVKEEICVKNNKMISFFLINSKV